MVLGAQLAGLSIYFCLTAELLGFYLTHNSLLSLLKNGAIKKKTSISLINIVMHFLIKK